MSHVRPDDKFGSGRSEHCTDFSTFWCQAMKNLEADHLTSVHPFPYFSAKRWKIRKHQISALYALFYFRHKIAFISNQTPGKKSRIHDGFLARRGNRFEGVPSQHCTVFPIFCCEAMKNLEAADLSTVNAFPCFGDICEGSGSQHCMRLSTFFIKKTCNQKQQNTSSIIRLAYWPPPCGCPWGDQIWVS